MSQEFVGNYSNNSFNAAKRYLMQFAKNKQIADTDLLNIQDISQSTIRQLISSNFPSGSSVNNGFKVVESTTNGNNFKVKGGDGTVEGAGVLFVDGYILFLKSDIEYNQQNNSGTITDDDYTNSVLDTLTTPGTNRTDEVYVDFYFAEVSGIAGSEYLDDTLLVSGLGQTANRLRIVQDIKVAEGGVTPVNGNDVNGIYHRYVKIATLNRTVGFSAITNAMITDNRIKINSVESYSQGTTITDLIMSDGQNIGNATHRIGDQFVSGNIDYSNDLNFDSSGIKATLTTSGNLGIGTATPISKLTVQGDVTVSDLTVSQIVETDANKKLISAAKATGYNLALGTTVGTVSEGNHGHTSMVTGVGTTNYVTKYTNGTGGISDSQIIDNGTNVGVGTANPQAKLQVEGNLFLSNGSNIGDNTHRLNTVFMASTIDYSNDLVLKSSTEKVRFATNGNVGIGSALPTKALVLSDSIVNVAIDHTVIGAEIGTDSNHPLMFKTNNIQQMAIDTVGNVGITSNLAVTGKIGIGTNPVAKLHVIGDAIISNNLTVSGTTTTINTAATTTDKLIVSQADDENALTVSQTSAGSSATVMLINNAGTGNALIIGNGNVGIGSANPVAKLDVAGNVAIHANFINNDGTTNKGLNFKNSSNVAYFTNTPAVSVDARRSLILQDDTSFAAGVGGGIGFAGKSDTVGNYQTYAAIKGIKANATDGSPTGQLHFQSSNGNLTTFMIINENGNIGIGTTNPLKLLHVDSNAVSPTIRIHRDTYAYTDLIGSTGTSGNDFDININGISQLYVKANSGIGIGTTDPTSKLHIVGTNVPVTIQNTYITPANSATIELFDKDGINTHSFWANGKTLISGNVGIGTTNPIGKLDVIGGDYVLFGLANPAVSRLVLTGDAADTNDNSPKLSFFSSHSSTNITGPSIQKINENSFGRGRLAFFQHAGGDYTSEAEVMSLTYSGNLGIGTTNPQNLLHVYSATGSALNLQNSGDAEPNIFFNSNRTNSNTSLGEIRGRWNGNTVAEIAFLSGSDAVNKDDGLIAFYTSDSASNVIERMRISQSGNVGINYNNPVVKLHVQGQDAAGEEVLGRFYKSNTAATTVTIELGRSDTRAAFIKGIGSNTAGGNYNELAFGTNPGGQAAIERMRIDEDGNVGINVAPTLGKLHVLANSDSVGIFAQGGGSSGSLLGSAFKGTVGSSDVNTRIFHLTNSNGDVVTISEAASYFKSNVGIGITNPSYKLHMSDNTAATQMALENTGDNSSAIHFKAARTASNTTLGDIDFRWGNNLVAEIRAISGSDAVNKDDGYLAFRVSNNASTLNTAMTIAQNGNVGIGTTNPLNLFHLNSSNPVIMFQDSTTNNISTITNGDSSLAISADINNTIANTNISFYIDNSEKVTITSTGRIGIGSTSPTVALDVIGNGRFSAIGSGTYVGAVNRTADGTLTTATSDNRLKHDIKTLENVLEKIMNLRGVSFKWNETNKEMIGMIAQELQLEFPELVFKNDVDGFFGINYPEFTAVLLEAIKSQQNKIKSLEDKIEKILAFLKI